LDEKPVLLDEGAVKALFCGLAHRRSLQNDDFSLEGSSRDCDAGYGRVPHASTKGGSRREKLRYRTRSEYAVGESVSCRTPPLGQSN
jgi:hypothetical protein